MAKNLQEIQFDLFSTIKDYFKKIEVKHQNSSPTGFWSILLYTYKLNIRNIG